MKIAIPRHRAPKTSRVRHLQETEMTLRDRIKTCVSQDRFESIRETSERNLSVVQDDGLPRIDVDALAQRMLMLNILGKEANVIRAGLVVCDKIADCLGIERHRIRI